MYKVSFSLGNITEVMKLSLSFIIDDDVANIYKKNYSKYITKFRYYNNLYLKIQPNPYLTIDISRSNKQDGYNQYNTVNINRYGQFLLIKNIDNIINKFKTIKDLFFYENNVLLLNKEYLKEVTSIIKLRDRTISIQPSVIEIGVEQHEGVIFAINNFYHYCYITFTELEFFLYRLKNIDIDSIVLHLIEIANLYKDEEIENIGVNLNMIEDTSSDNTPNCPVNKDIKTIPVI